MELKILYRGSSSYMMQAAPCGLSKQDNEEIFPGKPGFWVCFAYYQVKFFLNS